MHVCEYLDTEDFSGSLGKIFDDRDGGLFKVTVYRKGIDRSALSKTSGKTSGKILDAIILNSSITIPQLSQLIGVTERSIERNIQTLQKTRKLERIGPAKGGRWRILQP